MELLVNTMSNTFWLTKEEIIKSVNALATYCEKTDEPSMKNILKELGVAQARAESSRILGIRFKKSIGKTNNHIPVKLKAEEIEAIKQSDLDSTIRGLFNDVH